MKRVLVTGARGVVGQFLVRKLAQVGFEVHALSRAPEASHPENWHKGNLADAGWSRFLPRVDTVFHLAPLWLLPPVLGDLEQLGVQRIVAFGSTSRYTKAASVSPVERSVAQRLAQAEAELIKEAVFAEWTLFRPTLIYGAGRDQNVSDIARFILRFGFFPVAGTARGLRQPVHADDLAVACLAIMDNAATVGRSLDLGGGEALPYREMVRRIFHALDRPVRILPLPAALLRTIVGAASRLQSFQHINSAVIDRMATDMVVDNGPALSLFQYEPRTFHPSREDLGLRS